MGKRMTKNKKRRLWKLCTETITTKKMCLEKKSLETIKTVQI